MYIVTLEDAKKQCIVEHNLDDDYLIDLIDASYFSIKNSCNNKTWIDTSGVSYSSTDDCDTTVSGTTIPLPIKQAILLLVGTLYANRESVSFGNPVKIPFTIEWLIQPYIQY